MFLTDSAAYAGNAGAGDGDLSGRLSQRAAADEVEHRPEQGLQLARLAHVQHEPTVGGDDAERLQDTDRLHLTDADTDDRRVLVLQQPRLLDQLRLVVVVAVGDDH